MYAVSSFLCPPIPPPTHTTSSFACQSAPSTRPVFSSYVHFGPLRNQCPFPLVSATTATALWKPEFSSSASDFSVVVKKWNHIRCCWSDSASLLSCPTSLVLCSPAFQHSCCLQLTTSRSVLVSGRVFENLLVLYLFYSSISLFRVISPFSPSVFYFTFPFHIKELTPPSIRISTSINNRFDLWVGWKVDFGSNRGDVLHRLQDKTTILMNVPVVLL